jgi:hypothetical protein
MRKMIMLVYNEAFPKPQFWESNFEICSFVEPLVRRLKA